jgi:hypothetical protein
VGSERNLPKAPVAASATASIAYLHEDSGFFSRRSTSFLLVVGLHAALFYALVSTQAAFDPPLTRPPVTARRALFRSY